MHTAEHILNQAMIQMFGCGRSQNSHIERKKSKCDYHLQNQATPEQIIEIENRVNEVIAQGLPITVSYSNQENMPIDIDLSKLPEEVSETLRLVHVGHYDTCACIGKHVENTSEIGRFKIISTDSTEGNLRIRFKLEGATYVESAE
jgi:misacylated tRNA(Ala) deacylase